ncbi:MULTISPECIES: antibiotic biosynthesis monooxygenase [unclassified Pseudomonas]|uniref:antibiotic biosynthesis monooxygenase family protein n=1 Tax=unclassified Pseudomonas TaxID=196821 RepID=UPI000BC72A2A|nr:MULTISPECIES: antibiotic biosynthesis monooxygenase [unclassified Pseudomonas]PVZ20042.1 heme-degrading monooxygenase HmoA [Pseudomonas sp. URIL14HWK12:I12]PVZ27108.1 heme-degrading monooxygenase HmoA [Pseudomonas sp. URIL14HWK12:I10]PVZ37997.1 heme-degrading monooxygenase HmoA [Pseudomonas sp. URIL14HWK12:I11]SNZ04867.1 Heme-degrading monooxygenase HmoA [Pseudomonas sp. URIL14HWK12:I9]
MIAVIFQAWPAEGQYDRYLDLAAELRPLLAGIEGFISIERFQSLADPGKVLSLSFWEDEEAVAQWRNLEAHRAAQSAGRGRVLADYQLCIAQALRTYGRNDRQQAPGDSQQAHR